MSFELRKSTTIPRIIKDLANQSCKGHKSAPRLLILCAILKATTHVALNSWHAVVGVFPALNSNASCCNVLHLEWIAGEGKPHWQSKSRVLPCDDAGQQKNPKAAEGCDRRFDVNQGRRSPQDYHAWVTGSKPNQTSSKQGRSILFKSLEWWETSHYVFPSVFDKSFLRLKIFEQLPNRNFQTRARGEKIIC